MSEFDFSQVADFVSSNRTAFVVGGLVVSVALLLWLTRRAVRSGRPDKWLAGLSTAVSFGWSAEAMYEVATDVMRLPRVVVWVVFFVFEAQLLTSMLRAERHNKAHKTPGKYGNTAWLIATVMGAIAALAAESPTEFVLRLAVPLLSVKQWWDGMVGDAGSLKPDSVAWVWTPRRILVSLGLVRPSAVADRLEEVDGKRRADALAKVTLRLHSTSWTWRSAYYEMRQRRLAMHATDAMLDEARLRVERVLRAKEQTKPTTAREAERIVRAEREAEAARNAAAQARADAEQLRAEVDAERFRVEAEAERADQAEAFRVQAEAEAETSRAASGRTTADADQRVRALTLAAESADERARQSKEVADRRASEVEGLRSQVTELLARLADVQQRSERPRSRRAVPESSAPDDGSAVPVVGGVRPELVAAVLNARTRKPDATQKELAEAAGTTDRTVRKVLTGTEHLVTTGTPS